jgi:hypothetical protein
VQIGINQHPQTTDPAGVSAGDDAAPLASKIDREAFARTRELRKKEEIAEKMGRDRLCRKPFKFGACSVARSSA